MELIQKQENNTFHYTFKDYTVHSFFLSFFSFQNLINTASFGDHEKKKRAV